ncbi:MAG: protein kinase, partial [Myxococcales bacterium]|nr:protein kinase [Myxococcales bacterium]
MGGGLDFRGTERYAVERRLGAGGFGVVYQVHDRDRDVRVALKMLRRIDGEALYRFKKEFRSLADVSHPNLIPLHDLVVTDEHSFFTMELVSGSDFLTYVWRLTGETPIAHDETDLLRDAPTEQMARPTVDVGRLRVALRQLAAGVAGLHAAGKLHRDIKPSNVLIDGAGRLVLLDFGLVTDQEADGRTSGGAIVGTAAYMAPEQALARPVGEPADWYSVGVMLYEALTGTLPHTGSGLQVLLAKQRLDPKPPREIWPECPDDLDELCMALLQRDPADRASGDEIIERLGGATGPIQPRPSGPLRTVRRSGSFVGRREQLAALRQHLSDTRIGHPVVVHLHGHSGIGKSSLLASFEREVRASSDVVMLDGRCYERESVPFKAVDGVIDALARHLTQVRARELVRVIPPDAWFLSRLFPVLSRVPAIANADPPKTDFPDRAELRRRAVAGLKLLLQRIAERQPLVVQIDDLQWGDRDSVTLLDELLAPPDPPALLLLLCFRREERDSSKVLAQLLGSKTVGREAKHAREMPLEPMTPEETHELAERLLEGNAATALAQTIVTESGGSPLFVDELVRHHTELTESQSGQAGELTLEALIQARLSRLPEDVRRLLTILSICGQPVDDRLVGRAAGVSGDARRAIDILRSDHLIRATGDGRVEPYHARIRETLASQLPSEDAREMHTRLANALESVEPPDPEALTFHWERAGESKRAGHYAALAASRASDALAFDRAARYYQKALDLGELSRAQRGELYERLGSALSNVGRAADAAQAYLAAAELSEGLTSLDLRRRASAQQMFAGKLDDGLAILGTLLPELGLRPPRSPRSALLSYIGRRVLLRVRGLDFIEKRDVPAEELLRIDACADASVALGLSDVAYAVAYHARHLEL